MDRFQEVIDQIVARFKEVFAILSGILAGFGFGKGDDDNAEA